MNSAKYVDEQIKILKTKGIPLQDAAWEAAKLCIGFPYIFGDRGQYCTPEKRRAVYNAHPDQEGLVSKCQVLKGSKSSCDGCQWFPGGNRVRSFDCRGFTYWILLQIYGWELMGGGCTTQWGNEKNWKAKGEIADGIPQNTLLCVFYYKKDKNGRRTSTLQHTGLYLNGETIECSNGVQYSKTLNKKWDVWGMPACVGGDAPEPTPPTPTPPTPEPTPEPGTAIVTGKNVAMRVGPSTSAGVILRVPTGKTVKIDDPPDGWEYVEYNGKQGYMMKDFLKEG